MSADQFATSKPFYRWAERLQRLMTHELWFLVSSSPFWIALFVLAPVPGNVWLIALTAFSLGPALAALLYGARRLGHGEEDSPTRHFWRGYRMSARQALQLWTPVVAVASFVVFDLAVLRASDRLSAGWLLALGLLTVVTVPWAVTMLLIVSGYTFRTRDLARLSFYYLFRRPIVALVWVVLAVGASALIVATSELVLAAGMVVIAALVVWLGRPVTDDIQSTFIHPDDKTDTPGDQR